MYNSYTMFFPPIASIFCLDSTILYIVDVQSFLLIAYQNKFVGMIKSKKLREVSKSEILYEIPGALAVVESRINSGFFSPRFFGTLLVAFTKIQFFYIFTLCRHATVSTVRCFHSVFALCARQSRTAIVWSVIIFCLFRQ